MDGVDYPNIGHRADTDVDVEGADPPSQPDDTSDTASEALAPADPKPDDDWVPA